MGEHFLKWINIVDFKCFHNFEAKNFKRVNLISGKNNIGKTAFMEAIYINIEANSIDNLARSIIISSLTRNITEYARDENKKDQNYYLENTDIYKATSNLHESEFKTNYKDGIKEYFFNIDGKTASVNVNAFSLPSKSKFTNTIYLPHDTIPNIMLKTFFEYIQKKNKEKLLYKYIDQFDKTIIDFKIIGGDKPQCRTIDTNEYRDINEFGDGLKHYISIICALYACENGTLFIDELGNGIHYTHLDTLWKIILKISKDQNVQVFATTHSKECIESYARVAKKLEDQEIAFIELGKNKNNEIKAITMDYDRLQNEIENTNEVRGW